MERTAKAQNHLIFLCWFLYAVSYAGRYSYNANINLVMDEYAISRAQAGLVTGAYFFAYAIGQIVNAFLCRFYPRRFMLPVAMLLSAAVNLAPFFGVTYNALVVLWAVNGAVQSVLWTSLMHILGTSLSDDFRSRAVLVMGTTTAVGTFLAYVSSFLFVRFGSYRVSFLFSAAVMSIAAFAWLFGYRELGNPAAIRSDPKKGMPRQKKKLSRSTVVLLTTVSVFAVLSSIIKDGQQLWVPNVLKQTFSLPDDFSILLTMILPLIAILGVLLDAWLHKHLSNFLAMETVLFFLTALSLGGTVYFLQRSFVPVLVCFALTALLQAAVNNVNTSMVPLYLNHKVDPGLVSGITNACCYVGSTVSSYGLGALADKVGWFGVFRLLLILAVIPMVIGLIILTVHHIRLKKG